jgi:branched-chain amino acid transport system substrate-binding protein
MSKFLESNTSALAPGRSRRAPRVCLSRIGGSLVAGVALALAAMSPGSASAAEFKVGFIMSLTGPSGELGKVTLEGAQAGIEMVNSTGGIGGAKATLVICDVQSSEQQAVICARKLALQDKVNLMVGTGSTPQTIAIIPTVEAAGVPFFAVASSPQAYSPVKKFVFKGIPGLTDQIPAIVEYFKTKKLLRVAVIHDNGPLGAAIGNIFKQKIEGAGITVVDTLLYAPTDTDVSAQVTRMRADKPDAVLNIAITPPAGALIVKTMQQLGMNVPIVVGSNLQSKAFVDLVGDAVDKIVFPAAKVVLKDLPSDDPLRATIMTFRTNFTKVHAGKEPNSLSPWIVDPMLLAQKAAQPLGAKALDPKEFRDAIEGLHGVTGIQGIWTFSPTDHGPDLSNGMVLVKFKDNSWVPAQ